MSENRSAVVGATPRPAHDAPERNENEAPAGRSAAPLPPPANRGGVTHPGELGDLFRYGQDYGTWIVGPETYREFCEWFESALNAGGGLLGGPELRVEGSQPSAWRRWRWSEEWRVVDGLGAQYGQPLRVSRGPKGTPSAEWSGAEVCIDSPGPLSQLVARGLLEVGAARTKATRIDVAFDHRPVPQQCAADVVAWAGFHEREDAVHGAGQVLRGSRYLHKRSKRSRLCIYEPHLRDGRERWEPCMRVEVRAMSDLAPRWWECEVARTRDLVDLAVGEVRDRFRIPIDLSAGAKVAVALRCAKDAPEVTAHAIRAYPCLEYVPRDLRVQELARTMREWRDAQCTGATERKRRQRHLQRELAFEPWQSEPEAFRREVFEIGKRLR